MHLYHTNVGESFFKGFETKKCFPIILSLKINCTVFKSFMIMTHKKNLKILTEILKLHKKYSIILTIYIQFFSQFFIFFPYFIIIRPFPKPLTPSPRIPNLNQPDYFNLLILSINVFFT